MNYDEIIEKYSELILKIAMTHLNNIEDAEDIVQEVLIKFIQNKNFTSEVHERSWIIRVTINLCYNENKSAKRREVALTEDNRFSFNLAFENQIYEYIRNLKEKYRCVFELYYLQNMKIKEISNALKISEVAVRTRLKRARNEVKNMIKNEVIL